MPDPRPKLPLTSAMLDRAGRAGQGRNEARALWLGEALILFVSFGKRESLGLTLALVLVWLWGWG